MRSFFRFLSLVLLIGVGVALAVAVVTGSDPAPQQSPNEVVQALIDSAGGQTGHNVPEPRDRTHSDAETVDIVTAQGRTEEPTSAQGDAEDPVPTQGDTQQPTAAREQPAEPTPAEEDSKANPVNERLSIPGGDALPTIHASAVYITPPAMDPAYAAPPNCAVPYQVPYYPMVANQVAPTSAQAPVDEHPAAAPPASSGPLPPPPEDDARPADPAPESKIHRDEGDDSLIINLKDEDIRAVLELLSQQGELNILASKNVTGKVSATLNDVDVRSALKAILKSTGYVARYEDDFVYVGTPEDFKSMDQAEDVIGTRIYRPNYVTATELQTLVSPLLTDGVSKSTVSSPSEVDIPSDSEKTGGDNFANGDVLLVHDYESVLSQIDQIVEEVDRRPLQVAIEALILTVNLDDSNRIGVNFELLRDSANMRIISGMPPLNLANIDLPPRTGGLKIGFLDSSLSTLLEALESVGDTNVVASPKVMCLNKQRAEVHIGEELGYVTTTVTETAATQTVEFLEVGTQLRIRPFISSDGMIRMEIHPELSTGSLRPVNDMTIPDKEVTQVTSNIMCRDGCTVVIGGLIREQLDSTTTQIPLLGSLPLFGPAFRQKTEETTRDEIIVLITPQIVHDPFMYAEGQEAMRQARDRVELFADKMSPIGTRFYGRRYYRKAQAAWAAGDVDAALRYVNLAIHFDRQNPDALRLRREVISVCPQADNSVDARLRQGLLPHQHPHVDYSRSGWPSRAPEPAMGDEAMMQIHEVLPFPSAVGENGMVTESSTEDQTPRDPAPTPAVDLQMAPPPLPEEDQ